MGRVEGKLAIVTGAARGTGEATARLLAAEGATVLDVQDDLSAARMNRRSASPSTLLEADWGDVGHAATAVHVCKIAVLLIEAARRRRWRVRRVVRVNQVGATQRARGGARSPRARPVVSVSSIDSMTTRAADGLAPAGGRCAG
jgi:NAD(P)-dependent dehydrogenase (short-subunit alcohol dehydrogenase family)